MRFFNKKFTNISSDIIVDFQDNENDGIFNSEKIPSSNLIVMDIENSTKMIQHDNSTLVISDKERSITSNNASDSDFEIGLIAGVIVGLAIGIALLFIIRQKNT